ncbi:hypothetical protein ID866_4140 [Astraeus odoratus]|nr:hypothetical protein ID866_4140 [Astraeus odoratus]
MSKRNPDGPKTDVEEQYQRTLTRIAQIQSHLSNVPRGQRLTNKTCIITGVGSLQGIGRASALLFAHEGARHLYLLDFRADNLSELESTIQQLYPDVKTTVIQADAADEAAIAAVCKRAIDEEGRLDVFFANAGIVNAKALAELTPEDFMETMRVNTLSCFLAVKHGSRAMMHADASKGKSLSGGSIILTASVAGLRSGAGTVDCETIISSHLFGVDDYDRQRKQSRTSVYQLQRTDVRVNSICPGLIETNMTKDMFDFARQRGSGSKLGQLNPLGRYGVSQGIVS